MDDEDREILIEEAASAWRPSSAEDLAVHPAWEALDEKGRVEAFEVAQSLRKIEAGLDSDALSSTTRAVLERIEQKNLRELPPSEIDALIGAGEATSSEAKPIEATAGATVIPFRRRVLQAPWAIAAIALLGIGIGLWASRGEVGRKIAEPSPSEEPHEKVAAAEEEEVRPEPIAEPAPEAPRVADVSNKERRRRRPKASKDTAPSKSEPNDQHLEVARKEPSRDASKQVPSPAARVPEPEEELPELGTLAKGPQVGPGGSKALTGDTQAPASASSIEKQRSACRSKVAALEKQLREDKNYSPVPAEQLAIGRCYRVLGKDASARTWLRRATTHPETRARAEKALEELSGE